MVRSRFCPALYALGLLLVAGALKADEVREADLGGPGDAFTQLERLSEWSSEVQQSHRRPAASKATLPPTTPSAAPPNDFMIDFNGAPVDVKPLVPDHSFNPRTMGGLTKAEPKRDGMVGAPKVQFGDRRDVSLATISQNNQASADAIAQAGSPEVGFITPIAYDREELPKEKSFEEKLELLSQKEGPFSLQDYVEYRDFVAQNEDRVAELPNRDSRFHNNLKEVFERYGGTDVNRVASQPIRRLFGVAGGATKADTSKKRSGLGGRTH